MNKQRKVAFLENQTEDLLGDVTGIGGLNLSKEWSMIGSSVIENMRMMATRIRKNGDFPKMLSITSTLSGEGVSSICVGLGFTMAHDYQVKTCIVDLNWYSPSNLYRTNSNELGIADAIFGHAKVEDAVHRFGIENLSYIPAGNLAPGKRPIVARSKALGEALRQVGSLFEYVILDLPPVLVSSDTVHMAAYAEACCLVIQQGVTPTHEVKMALDEIDHLNILGVVLNRVNIATPDALVRLLTE